MSRAPAAARPETRARSRVSTAAPPTVAASSPPLEPGLVARPVAASAIAALLAACATDRGERTRRDDILGRSPLTDATRPLFDRVLGELAAAAEFELLGPGWAVLHAIPLGGREADIAHLVIGPAGVFAISAQLHRGAAISTGRSQVFTDGQAQPYIAAAISSAQRASKLLTAALQAVSPVAVRPVLTFAAARSFAGKPSVDGVALVATETLTAWIAAQPVVWRADAVAQVLRAARSADTWTARAIDPQLDAANQLAFAELRRHVALTTRVAWAWRCGCLAAGDGLIAFLAALAR
jgi:hypothetical protein